MSSSIFSRSLGSASGYNISHQLFISCRAVLVVDGQLVGLAFRAKLDGLRVALDGELVAAALEVLVALVLRGHGTRDRVLRLE